MPKNIVYSYIYVTNYAFFSLNKSNHQFELPMLNSKHTILNRYQNKYNTNYAMTLFLVPKGSSYLLSSRYGVSSVEINSRQDIDILPMAQTCQCLALLGDLCSLHSGVVWISSSSLFSNPSLSWSLFDPSLAG